MKKLRIGVDIDNVLRAFAAYSVEKWNEQFPDKPTLSTDMWSDHAWCYKLFSGQTARERRAKCFDWWIKEGIYENAPALQGAQDALFSLSQRQRHKIVIISHQTREAHPEAALVTTKWLYKHNIYFDELHYVSDKSVVAADILIDDNPNIIENFLNRGVSDPAYAIMFEFPWNDKHEFQIRSNRNKLVFVMSDEEKYYWPNTVDLVRQITSRRIYGHQ